MRTRVRLLMFAFCLVGSSAWADATAFLGSLPSPANRAVKGVAIGAGFLVVGFEFEYATSGEDRVSDAPALRTGMGNVLLQTPFAIGGVQPYATTGAGLYRERLGDRQETSMGFNVGGGAKVAIAGPLRLRLDYRVFRLLGDPVRDRVHRVYAGANLRF